MYLDKQIQQVTSPTQLSVLHCCMEARDYERAQLGIEWVDPKVAPWKRTSLIYH